MVFAFPLNNRLLGAILFICKFLRFPRFWAFWLLSQPSQPMTGRPIVLTVIVPRFPQKIYPPNCLQVGFFNPDTRRARPGQCRGRKCRGCTRTVRTRRWWPMGCFILATTWTTTCMRWMQSPENGFGILPPMARCALPQWSAMDAFILARMTATFIAWMRPGES